MGEIKGTGWYNSLKPWQRPVRFRPSWPRTDQYRRHSQVVRHLSEGWPIVDLGCGVGTLAAMAWHAGHRTAWIGLDFATSLLEIARKGNALHGNKRARFVEVDFGTGSAINAVPRPLRSRPYQVVATELLEHIDDDLDLLAQFSGPRRRALITVPLDDAPAHVRHFPKLGDATDRYGKIIRIERTGEVKTAAGIHSWLLVGRFREREKV